MVGRLERQLAEFKGQVDTEQRRREAVQQRLVVGSNWSCFYLESVFVKASVKTVCV